MLVERARQKNPFVVVQMSTNDFVSLKSVRAQIVKRKTNIHKEKVNWHNIRWIQVSKEKPYQLHYRYSLNALEAWKVLNIQRKCRGRPADIGRIELQPLYSGPRPLATNKLNDLKMLLQFIPPVYHTFYTALESSTCIETSSDSEGTDSD